MNAFTRSGLVASLALGLAASASAMIYISPNSDPGNAHVGDTLTFTVSTDSITPPPSGYINYFSISGFQIAGPTTAFNLGICANLLSGPGVTMTCGPYVSSALWWASVITSPISGDLFSVVGHFTEVGTYSVSIDTAIVDYFTFAPVVGHDFLRVPLEFSRTSPLLINVTEVLAVPEPATAALVALALAGIALSRRASASSPRS